MANEPSSASPKLSVHELKSQLRELGCTDFSAFLEREDLVRALQSLSQQSGVAQPSSDACCNRQSQLPAEETVGGTVVRNLDVGAGLEVQVVEFKSAFDNTNTGAILWDGSVQLARYIVALLANPGKASVHVVELGCGTGLAGIAAGMRGARVVLTDLGPVLEQTTRANLEANQSTLHDSGGSVILQPLAFGEDVSSLAEELPMPLDYILAADVVYRPELFDLLKQTILQLSSAGTKVLISYTRRRSQEEWFFSDLCDDFECSIVACSNGDCSSHSGADVWRSIGRFGESAIFCFTRKFGERDADAT